MKAYTGQKAIWAVRKLGGEARPIEVHKYIHPFDPDISKGAIGTAMVRLGQKGDLIKEGDDPQAPYHIPVQPRHEVPSVVDTSVAPQKTTTAELVLRVAKKKGRKLRKRDLVAAIIEEDPALQPLSVAALISRMAKRGDLVRTKRGKFPLFGPPKEPEPTEQPKRSETRTEQLERSELLDLLTRSEKKQRRQA